MSKTATEAAPQAEKVTALDRWKNAVDEAFAAASNGTQNAGQESLLKANGLWAYVPGHEGEEPEQDAVQEAASEASAGQPAALPPAEPETENPLECVWQHAHPAMAGEQHITAPDGVTRFHLDAKGITYTVRDGRRVGLPPTCGLDKAGAEWKLLSGKPRTRLDPQTGFLTPEPGPLRWVQAADPDLAGQVVVGPDPLHWKLTLNAHGRGFAPDNARFEEIPGFTLGVYLTKDEAEKVSGFIGEQIRQPLPAAVLRAQAADRMSRDEQSIRIVQMQAQHRPEDVSEAQRQQVEGTRIPGLPNIPSLAQPGQLTDPNSTGVPGVVVRDKVDPNRSGLPPHLSAHPATLIPGAPPPVDLTQAVDPNESGLPEHLRALQAAPPAEAPAAARVEPGTAPEDAEAGDEPFADRSPAEAAQAARVAEVAAEYGGKTKVELVGMARDAGITVDARESKTVIAEQLARAQVEGQTAPAAETPGRPIDRQEAALAAAAQAAGED